VTDAIEMQARAGTCYGVRFIGERFDTGTPLGLLTTSIAFALKRADLAPDLLRAYMREALDLKMLTTK
jgi:UTP--glucose-1-phosphate uridylyltransferase